MTDDLRDVTDPDQAYYWTLEWQARERESEEDLARGDFETFESAAEALAWLQS